MSKVSHEDNIGQTGIDSIRLGGVRVSELPIAEQAQAKPQIPLFIDTERRNKVAGVLARFPKQRVDYLKSKIQECQTNVTRMGLLANAESQRISEYSGLITLCEFRDKEITRILEDDPEQEAKIKDLEKRFPLYDVKAMGTQIQQSRESIERANEVVAREYNSMAEVREVLVLCERRDAELRNLGARIE